MRFQRFAYGVLLLAALSTGIGPGVLLAQDTATEDVVANWEEGTWRFGDAPVGESTVRLTFTGDWRPARVYESMARENPEALYGEILPVLRQSDITLANVETAIGTRGEPIPKGGPNFQAGPDMLNALTVVPFDVALLANNHSADYGPAGLEETIELLREAGLETVGAGLSYREASQPLIMNFDGTSVAIINCAEGEEVRSVQGGPGVYGMNVAVQTSQIQDLRPHVDAVIVVFHGGREYAPSPPPYVAEALRTFAEAGADAVIAHHPHVPQGIEVVNGAPIVYSQGNFIFWQTDRYYRQIGYLVSLDVADEGLVGMSLTPYQQTPEGLVRLVEPHRSEFLQDLETLSGYLQEEEGLEELWNAYIDYAGSGASQLEQVAEGLQEGNERSAVIARNLFFTPAHRQLFIDRMNRIIAGEMDTAPGWAQQMLDQWLNRPAGDLPAVTSGGQ